MNVRNKRLEEDIKKVRTLETEFQNVLEIIKLTGNPTSSVGLNLRIPTAGSREYPTKISYSTKVEVELTARYPFEPPKVSILSPVWNPNVYASGLVCLGFKWIPTQGLDLLVLRVMQLLAFDPLIVNTSSPANAQAAIWYRDTVGKHPTAFPTINLDSLRKAHKPSTIRWVDMEVPKR